MYLLGRIPRSCKIVLFALDFPENCRATSNITSPVLQTLDTIPSRSRFLIGDVVEQKKKVDTWSVKTRLISSVTLLLNELSPASTCATGTFSFAAVNAAARVEFVSP